MLFFATRMLLLVLLVLLSFFILKHSKVVKKRLCVVVAIAICVLAVAVTGMFPPENAFITFKTPEAVCQYTAVGDVEAVVEGEASACVIYKAAPGEYSYCIVPKTSTGYKIPTYFYKEKMSQKMDASGVFTTYHGNDTNDYYIFASISSNTGELLQVFDATGEIVQTHGVIFGRTNSQCVYLQNFSNDYYTMINGEKFSLGE